MNDLTNQQNLNAAPSQPFSQSSFKPSMQTMIALLFFIGTIVSLLMYRYGTTHNFFNYDDVDFNDWDAKTKEMNIAFYSFWRNCELFHFLVPLVGYSLLYKLASNRSARLFVILTIIGTLVGMVFTIIYYQDIINHFTTDSKINETLSDLISYGWIVSELCCIYAFSMLLGDKCLSAKNKSWIGLLLLRWILVLSIAVSNLVTGGMQKVYNETMTTMTTDNWAYSSDSKLSYQDFFQNSGLYPALWQILTLIIAFALWHMARSEAFSKPYDATQPIRLSPLNKWVGAAVTCAALVTCGLYLLYTTVLSEFFI